MKKFLISCLMLPMMTGCSLMNPSPGNGQKPDWDRIAPTIQNRVKYVAAFAFTMEQVKPHKAEICAIADQISGMLDNYMDRDASFETVRTAIMNMVNQIPDPNVRQAATIFVDMVLTEAFNYAWQHYEDLLNRDEVQTTILIAKAVGNGLRDACAMTVSTMSTDRPSYAYNVFTVPKD